MELQRLGQYGKITSFIISRPAPKVLVTSYWQLGGLHQGNANLSYVFSMLPLLCISVCSLGAWERNRFLTLKVNIAKLQKIIHTKHIFSYTVLLEAWVARCSPNSNLGCAQTFGNFWFKPSVFTMFKYAFRFTSICHKDGLLFVELLFWENVSPFCQHATFHGVSQV